jgi:hypothetical protein
MVALRLYRIPPAVRWLRAGDRGGPFSKFIQQDDPRQLKSRSEYYRGPGHPANQITRPEVLNIDKQARDDAQSPSVGSFVATEVLKEEGGNSAACPTSVAPNGSSYGRSMCRMTMGCGTESSPTEELYYE